VTEVFADLATFITRRQRPTEAHASFSAGAGPAEEVPVTSEDAATILVRFDNGARGACVVSQVSAGRKNAFSLEVDGSRRALAWAQEQPNELWLGSRNGGSTLMPREPEAAGPGVPSLPPGHPEGWGEAFRDLFRPFYATVAAGAPPPAADAAPYPTLADGARAVRFVEAVLASSAAGRWVALG
jgi:predicted dehydrogenase